MEKRVVVTGMGVLSALGDNLHDFWGNIVNGKSGARLIEKFDTSHFKTKFACELAAFDAKKYLSHQEIKKADLYTQYGIYAATQAVHDSGFDIDKIDPFDVGVIWGTGQGGMDTFEKEVTNYVENGPVPKYNPFFVPKIITNMAAGMISMKFGLMGINYTTVSACATGNTAIMDAFNYIKWGKAKIILTGGSESPISPASVAGFNAMRALSTNNEHYTQACRPFDAARDGFVMGEGAGALVLEDRDHAIERGATIYAEVVGAGMTADAYHLTATHPEGVGAAKAAQNALTEAGLNSKDVDYLNAHATSTAVGDTSEVNAINNIFGSDNDHLSVSATKSMTGHLLGAAGAIESIISIMAIRNNVVPPTINVEKLDDAITNKEQYVCNVAREKNIAVAMSNTFGFGGHNAVVVLKEY